MTVRFGIIDHKRKLIIAFRAGTEQSVAIDLARGLGTEWCFIDNSYYVWTSPKDLMPVPAEYSGISYRAYKDLMITEIHSLVQARIRTVRARKSYRRDS